MGCGDVGYELWGGLGSTANGNFWSGTYICLTIDYAPSGQFTFNNNTAYVGGSTDFGINRSSAEDGPYFRDLAPVTSMSALGRLPAWPPCSRCPGPRLPSLIRTFLLRTVLTPVVTRTRRSGVPRTVLPRAREAVQLVLGRRGITDSGNNRYYGQRDGQMYRYVGSAQPALLL